MRSSCCGRFIPVLAFCVPFFLFSVVVRADSSDEIFSEATNTLNEVADLPAGTDDHAAVIEALGLSENYGQPVAMAAANFDLRYKVLCIAFCWDRWRRGETGDAHHACEQTCAFVANSGGCAFIATEGHGLCGKIGGGFGKQCAQLIGLMDNALCAGK